MTPEKLPETNAPQFTVWQSTLPNRLGISIEEVRARREAYLTEGVHWQKTGARILLSPEGERLLRESLALPAPANVMAPPHAPDEETDPTPPSPQKGPLVVTRSAPQIRNQRIVEARHEGEQDLQLIWVKDNTRFRVGHVIPLAAVERRVQGQWTYVAGRPPR